MKYFIVVLFLINLNKVYSKNKNTSPISIITSNWSSQIILSHITGLILKETGHQVKFISLSTDGQWSYLSNDDAHIQIEVWEGTMRAMYNKLVKKGAIVDAGNHSAKTREEWWYPLYVEKLCPGLPDWKALKKCYSIFSTPESEPYGLYVTGPWEKPDDKRIKALGLKFKVLNLGNADEIWKRLKTAYEKKKPILILNWTPNFIEKLYDGKFVEFPNYSKKCETDPKWGTNKKEVYDCGNPKNGWLKKVVSRNFPKEWPCAFEILKNIDFNNSMISELTKQLEYGKMPLKRVAYQWFDQHKDLWKKWIPKNCIAK